MKTSFFSPTVAVHRSARLRAAGGRIALASLLVLAPAVGMAQPAAASVDYAGTCTFGPTSPTGPLTMTISASTISVTGYGTCVGTTNNSVYLTFGGYGTFTCAGGAGSMGGSVAWTPTPPAGQDATADVVAGPGSVHLTLIGTINTFAADGQFIWSSPGALEACPTSSSTTTTLAGTMTYEAP